MSSYVVLADYERKDSLVHGDPDKIVSGTELQAEFDAIASAVNSKIDSSFTMVSAIQTTQVAQVLADMMFKAGMILPFSGLLADVPSGWAICDGTNGTPDLRGRFVLGVSATHIKNETGGAESTTSDAGGAGTTGGHALDSTELPASFDISLTIEGSNNDNGDPGNLVITDPADSNGHQTLNFAHVDIPGGGQAHTHTVADHTHSVDTMPPYYALYYIMYVGFDTGAEIGAGDVQAPLAAGVLDDLADVAITSPAAGDILYYDGSTWKNGPPPLELDSQTGVSYTLALTDAGKVVEMSNASANTLTVPPNSSVAFPIGTAVLVRQMGAGLTTIAAGAGVTIRTPRGLDLAAQYALVSLHKRATNEWCLEGDLA